MEPVTKRLKLENEELKVNNDTKKEQIGWYDLPYDIRYMIIEAMDTPTKCKFSRVSKQCEKEVGMSRNFIEEISVDSFFESVQFKVKSRDFFSTLKVRGKLVSAYGKDDSESNENDLFYIPQPAKKWEMREEGDLNSIVARYFNYILKNASNSSMNLKIDLADFPFETTNIRHLKKLKKIEVYKPDRNVDLIECGFLDPEQLYKIPEKVMVFGVRLNFEQIIQLRADYIVLETLEMTSEELNQYFKLWMNGQLHANLKQIQMDTRKVFENEEIIRGLEFIHIVNHDWLLDGKLRFKLRSLSNPDRMAKVRFNEGFFIMCIDKYIPELTFEEKMKQFEELQEAEGFNEDAVFDSSDDEYGCYDSLVPMIRL